MGETFGQPPAGSSLNLACGGCLSRTCRACFPPAKAIKGPARREFGETYAEWISRLRLDSSQRRRLRLRTSVSEFSSSPPMTRASGWPTPTALDSNGSGVNATMRDRLDYAAEKGWSTPGASQWATPRASEAGADFAKLTRSSTGIALPAQAVLWKTPRVAEGDYTRDRGKPGAERLTLEGEAKQWPTPTAMSYGESHQPGNSRSMNLTMQLAEGIGPSSSPPFAGDSGLHGRTMPTDGPGSAGPLLSAYRRYRDTTCSQLRWERRALLLMAIRRQGRGWTRRRASVPARPAFRRQLNPRFVEILMGWPRGWTNCDCSEMGLFHWRRLMRSELLRLDYHDAPPAQPDLFA